MSTTLEIAIFLSMNGKAQDAINFYKKHFNAEQLMIVTYADLVKMGDKSIEINDENRNHISHSVFKNR
ncbi:putative glyoxalase superfamily protein PhnB [Clostridium beijerinckii]|uniref:hypothetical protein n=1 Tax=Clostridium beijerinckii TaxID=1520 RepID=UPI001F4BD5FA|nr:hypothetical protein [Clostridium beijerinckii]NRZ52808.1 putative glyoxalase superfamily protein PhnB [Clostridium beijerinckii]